MDELDPAEVATAQEWASSSTPARKPARVVAVVLRDGRFRLGAIDEGTPGYWPLDALGAWASPSEAQREADVLNAALGIAEERARRIARAALDGDAGRVDA